MALPACSLSGQPFAADHQVMLRVVAQARGWQGLVWVPEKVMQRLDLSLRPNTAAPLLLTASNRDSVVYHAEQFAVPLPSMQEAWRAFVAKGAAAPSADVAALNTLSACPLPTLPLSTNGERFDPETEARMLRHSCTASSPYWATAAEAAYVYNTPFHAAHLADTANAVVSTALPLCRPVAFYHVSGTTDPSRFTAATCRRYDPVNYEGRYYKPSVGVAMKAFAVRHHCLHERQWITTNRAVKLGLSVPKSIVPVYFYVNQPLDLVNVAVMRRTTTIRGRILDAAAKSPREREEVDAMLESQLLMVSTCPALEETPAASPSLPSLLIEQTNA